MQLTAIIVEDEPYIRDDLRHMLTIHPEIDVVGEAGDVGRAKSMLAEHVLDVIFLDIQLRGGSGMELLPFIPPDTSIVFITAFNEYAVRAFEINALDYILKPLSGDRLAITIDRLKARTGRRALPSETRKPLCTEDQVFLKTDSEQVFVLVETIRVISSIGGNYTSVFLDPGKKLIVRKTFKEWEELLPESLFLRVHRSTIVNREKVRSIQKIKTERWVVNVFGHPDPFAVSRRMVSRLKKLLGTGQVAMKPCP